MSWTSINANRFHYLIFTLWQFALCFCAQQLFPIFFNFVPDRQCNDRNGKYRWNASSKCIPIASDQCELLKVCENISIIDPPFHSVVEYFHLFCGSKAYSATLINTCQLVGVLVGGILYGHISDHFGRRRTSIFGITLGALSAIAGGFSTSWEMFAVFRFFVGTSASCILVVFYTYIMELILPEQRIFLRSFFNWGNARMLFTFICFLLPHWRYASYVTPLLVVPIIPILVILPESPKWYASKYRYKEAKDARNRIERWSGNKVSESNETDRESNKKSLGRIYTMTYLLRNRKLSKRTAVACALWFSTNLSALGTDLNSAKLGGNFFVDQFILGAAISVSKTGVFIMDSYFPKFSRRLLHQIPQAMMILCYAAIMFIMIFAEPSKCKAKTSVVDWIVVVLNVIGISFIEITWDACYVSAAENFPTEVRSIGMGTCSLAARIGALIAPQLAYLSRMYQAIPYILVVIIGVICLIISILFLEDTKGMQLSSMEEETKFNNELNPK